jgi:hypothetical protein
MAKKQTTKYPPRITVELDNADFRNQAQRAIRRMGYMTLSEYIREKLTEAIQQIQTTTPAPAKGH